MAAYFSGMLRSDWPKAVDDRSTTQPEEGVISALSKSGSESVGQKESLPGIGEGLGEKDSES